MTTTKLTAVLAVAVVGAILVPSVWAQESADAPAGEESDLAQELTNPVADLLTIPIQMNYDQNIGPAVDGWRFRLQANFVLPKP